MTPDLLPPVIPSPPSVLYRYGLPLAAAVAWLALSHFFPHPALLHFVAALFVGATVYQSLEAKRYRQEHQAMEQLLQSNEQSFIQSLDGATHGMALISGEGKWLRANKAVSRITGYTPDELLELDFQTITHPDDLDADLHYVQQVLDRKIETYSMEKRYIRKDGSIIWILLTVTAMWDAAGNFRYFISEIQDIHDRKLLQEKLRASEAKLRQR